MNSPTILLRVLLGLAGFASARVFCQVTEINVQRIETSQTIASTMPMKLLYDSTGNLYAAGQGIDGGLVVMKFSPVGSMLWGVQYRGTEAADDRPAALALDAAGNLIVAAASKEVNVDYVTLKLSDSGVAMWTNRLNGVGNGDDAPEATTVDAAGNVYVTGRTYDSAVQPPLLPPVVNYSITTVSYSPAGEQRWRSDLRGLNYRHGDGIAVDNQGHVFVSGMEVFQPDPRAPADWFVVLDYDAATGTGRASYHGDSNSGGGHGNTTVAIGPDGQLVFAGMRNVIGQVLVRLVKFGTNLVPAWSSQMAVSGNWPFDKSLAGLRVDAGGDIFIAASYANPNIPSLPLGGADFQVAKFDAEGNRFWQKSYENSAGPNYRPDLSTALLLDGAGNAIVTGTSPDALGVPQWATLKYSPTGANLWTARYGGDTNRNFLPLTMRLDAKERLFVAGTTPGWSGEGTDLLVITYAELKGDIRRLPGGRLHLEFVAVPDSVNRLQRSVNLVDWMDLTTLVADATGLVSYDIDPDAVAGFFRTVSP